ncbi:hypothetical protein swp_0922 [Shewanella piezotolerans WP3]|uniref:Uncharacterized protein n=1 Tax=Shewanella piezotolerans (strain WP3 / JCM 13877) TaxID=225849 RepID=B8CK25_SHEPW|nr:hypothetical protein swp_0922 [Shewanella piezotolerans WP3]
MSLFIGEHKSYTRFFPVGGVSIVLHFLQEIRVLPAFP